MSVQLKNVDDYLHDQSRQYIVKYTRRANHRNAIGSLQIYNVCSGDFGCYFQEARTDSVSVRGVDGHEHDPSDDGQSAKRMKPRRMKRMSISASSIVF